MNIEDWVTSGQAARILTENSGHEVSDAYVRQLARRGKFVVLPISNRTKLYRRQEVEQFRVQERTPAQQSA